MSPTQPGQLDDDRLFEAIRRLYAELDPAPGDLADGILARLAVDDLETEYELLTLVERVDLAAGVRGGAEDTATSDQSTVALEFASATYRVLVRVSTVGGHRRLDGWVVPAVPMKIYLGPEGDEHAAARGTAGADESGRFEFPHPATGEVRLWLLPQGTDANGAAVPPFVTPPFLI